MIEIDDLRKVSGIGEKTIQRIKDTLLKEDKYISEYNPELHLDINNIYQGDCLELMNGIPDKSIDMVLCDLPYGMTACKWDSVIPFEPLWAQYNRVIKDNGAIVLFGSEPFSSKLRMSSIEMYKYDWVWEKNKSSNHINAPYQPMKNFENVMIFGKKATTYSPKGNMCYHPQGVKKMVNPKPQNKQKYKNSETFHSCPNQKSTMQTMEGYPKAIIRYNVVPRPVHPTQKPVELIEYLIKTYTSEGETVLDNCMGSGTTAIASINTNRNFIGIELESEYCNLAKDRVNKHIIATNMQDSYSQLA